MGDVSGRHPFAQVAYLQGERQPLLGPNDAELLRTYPSKLPFIVGNPHKQVASENVARSLCVCFTLVCLRPEVTPPLKSNLG